MIHPQWLKLHLVDLLSTYYTSKFATNTQFWRRPRPYPQKAKARAVKFCAQRDHISSLAKVTLANGMINHPTKGVVWSREPFKFLVPI